MRLMIIGNKNVGKTSLKIRLVGSSSNIENEKAYQQVYKEKPNEEMTHGVDVLKWYDEKNNINFTLWDFAGFLFYFILFFLFNMLLF